VTSFFRDPATYDCLAARVLPAVWPTNASGLLRVWSAGCSTGEEVYSLSMLMHAHANRNGGPRSLRQVRIVGSDVDRDAIATARHGRYAESAFTHTPASIRDRYFPLQEGIRTATPELRGISSFEHGDMLNWSLPVAGKVNLIVCRNVVIYFTRTTQEALFSRFHDLLLPGGFLVLGKVETLLGKSRDMFAPVSSRERIFKRL